VSGSPGRLLVYGAGGHGKVVADVARSAGWTVAGFIDDRPDAAGTRFFGAPVTSWASYLADRPSGPDVYPDVVALGIGDNAARERSHQRLQESGITVPLLVHATAVIAPSAVLQAGTVVMALAVVNPDAEVGPGAILNTGSVVEHDCRLGRFVHLSPNAALGGTVRIGDRTHIGLGAVVLPAVRVGADVRVGAGAVVHRDTADAVTMVGVPARPLTAGTAAGPGRPRASSRRRYSR
jgi:sugar O-acyltransferase (sialic acid O-acetyltransferase NeuD family)